jgi:hypothetical protein
MARQKRRDTDPTSQQESLIPDRAERIHKAAVELIQWLGNSLHVEEWPADEASLIEKEVKRIVNGLK